MYVCVCVCAVQIIIRQEDPQLSIESTLISVLCGVLFLILMVILAVSAFKISRLQSDAGHQANIQQTAFQVFFLYDCVCPADILFCVVVYIYQRTSEHANGGIIVCDRSHLHYTFSV